LPGCAAVATDAAGFADIPLERWYLWPVTAGWLARTLEGVHAMREGTEGREGWLDTNGMLTFVRFVFAAC